MKKIDKIALVTLILGGLNWGLWSVFEFNVIDYVFGEIWIDQVIYFAMGAAAVYAIFAWKQLWANWLKKAS
jgi:uncharacterized membrane protein YuzA (DUF378 family)